MVDRISLFTDEIEEKQLMQNVWRTIDSGLLIFLRLAADALAISLKNHTLKSSCYAGDWNLGQDLL